MENEKDIKNYLLKRAGKIMKQSVGRLKHPFLIREQIMLESSGIGIPVSRDRRFIRRLIFSLKRSLQDMGLQGKKWRSMGRAVF